MREVAARLQGASIWRQATALVRFRVDGESLTWLAVAVGVLLRLMEYAANRTLYKDEYSLLDNLIRKPVFDLWTALTEHQLAPPGFLVLERLMVRLPIPVTPAARLIPLLCAIASMLLFPKVARRYLDRAAVPVATTLFALNDYLLYYSSEIKQYSGEVMLTLVALLLAARPASEVLASRRQLALLTAFGAAATWFAFPMALVLAGIGTRWIVLSALGRRWREARHACAMCLVWGVSFVVCFAVGQKLLDQSDTFMDDWWNFAFLPFPPKSLGALTQEFWQVMNVFINPACLHTPLNPPYSAFLDLGFFVLGAVSLGRRWRGGIFLVLSPILFALAASVLHKYPFHGRLLLYLVPSILLLVGQGVAVTSQRIGRLGNLALITFVLFQPVTEAFWTHVIVTRFRTFDSHGDLYPDLLDYFEQQERLEKLRNHFGLQSPKSL